MSILLLLVFLSTLLILGFGWGAWTLGGIVMLLSAGISFLMVGVDIQNIQANWAERRCDLDVLITGFLYKPSDDTRTRGDFSTDNFKFCVDKMMEESLKTFMTPLLSLFSDNINAAGLLGEVFNVIRDLKATIMRSVLGILLPIYERYKATAMRYAINYQRLRAAFSRASTSALAIAFAGLSAATSAINGIEFVIKVVAIIMWIMVGLIILIWFPLLPFLFIIFAVLTGIEEAGYSKYTGGGLRGGFCFDPTTLVIMEDGKIQPMRNCNLGDRLHDGTVIEGILETDAQNESMYKVDGIIVSGTHLIWNRHTQAWISVSDYPEAKPVSNQLQTLLCLRTSARNIPILGHSGSQWLFKDWEELPLSITESDHFWDFLVSHILNNKRPSWSSTPNDDPLLLERCIVRLRTGEKVSVSQIRIGDEIFGSHGFTKVLGTYTGLAGFTEGSLFSDGIWIQEISSSEWSHPVKSGPRETKKGYHLVTESGTFWMEAGTFSGFVRDFTEVGVENLYLTYGFTQALLQRATRLKKSLGREESCVQDFLSRDFLSCS